MATRNQQRRRSGGASGAITFDVSVLGIAGLQELLSAMPGALRNGILKPIVERLAATGARIAKSNLGRMLPKRDPATRRWDRPTGALRDSLGSNVMPLSKMRNKDIVFGLYGARRDFRVTRMTGRRIAGIRKTKVVNHRRTEFAGPLAVGRTARAASGRTIATRGAIQPSKYIHLVERGHAASTYFPAARPYPFMLVTRNQLRSMLPQILNERWSVLYPQQVAKLTRRYMRRAGVATGGA